MSRLNGFVFNDMFLLLSYISKMSSSSQLAPVFKFRNNWVPTHLLNITK